MDVIDFETENRMDLPNNRRIITERGQDCIMKYEVNEAGELDGIAQQWYVDGTYDMSCYINGLIVSFYQQWMVNEIVCGLHKEWHTNGAPKCEYTTKNGVKDGLYEEWDEEGKTVKTQVHKGIRIIPRDE